MCKDSRRVARLPSALAAALAMLLVVSSPPAGAFGLLGHRVAERIAEPRLCARARATVLRLSDGASLVGLGGWADRVRSDSEWQVSAPWHYVNVPDRGVVPRGTSARRDDVLWAIAHFRAVLAATASSDERKAQALKFLVHFIVDVHQPLHVGRARDRGGNTIELIVAGRPTNLHRLWDTDVLVRAGSSEDAIVAQARGLAAAAGTQWANSTPWEWANESFELRSLVYAFDQSPDDAYLSRAATVLEQRLAQAGVRLAAVLNAIYC